MSDFTSSYWSYYITTLVILGLIACMFLLWKMSKSNGQPIDPGENGHVWDEDLREQNNPLPLWWVGLFVLTTVFAGVYLFLFPGLGSYKGNLNWSSTQELAQDAQANRESIAPLYAKFDALSIQEISKDPKAMAIGNNLYLNNCAQCHASDAKGSKGFPNLTDEDWLHGGTPEKIQETITLGRIGQMPPMAQALGSSSDVENVANYVLSLSASPHDAAKAQKGQEKFAVCAACHGADGKGMQAIGSANLSDKLWLHGFGQAAIENMIVNGKVNQMPAQKGRLSESQIRVLSAYIWGLSNNKTPS